jgi:phenylacetate-coenzyme A ligase PaaK-like adenylate-forming protein
VRRFDSTQPLAEIVAGLNTWQPENLIAYASMALVLASEQIARRLRIAPRAVMCASEVLTAEAARLVERAFGSAPFDVYAATETAGIASHCRRRRSHLYEDLVIAEVVDEHNRPVPAGEPGAKVLVTVLFSRTQPLIRYEMSDRLRLATEPCDCGLPFALLGAIEGRTEDVLHLPGIAGTAVDIHPNVFHQRLESLAVRQWQVIETTDAIRVLLVKPSGPLDRDALRAALASDLRAAGALPLPVRIELVDAIERTAVGKAPLVRAARP